MRLSAVSRVWHGWWVTETREAVRGRTSWGWLRRAIGGGLLVLTAAAAVLFVLGTWNPLHLVVLEYRFGNPMVGLVTVPIGALLGLWLAVPVRNEARQRARLAARVVAGALLAVGLFGWGVFGEHFTFDAEEVARSPDGDRALAIVSDRGLPKTQYLRVWVGSGLTAREAGEIGRVCGSTTVRFLTADRVEIDTSYGTWQVDLDPATGAPRQVLGPHCSDGPVPATLGP